MAEFEVKEIIESIGKNVTAIQDEHKKLISEGKSNSESLEKATKSLEDLSGKFQKISDEIISEKKAREDLEVKMSRIKESADGDKAFKGSELYAKEFKNFVRFRTPISQEAIDGEAKALCLAYGIPEEKSMQVKSIVAGSNPDGGYLASLQFSTETITRARATSPMRNIASVATIGASKFVIPLNDGLLPISGWVGETETRTNSGTTKRGLIEIEPGEIFANPAVSEQSIDDLMYNVEADIQNQIVEEFGYQENTAFVNGNGVKKPRGLTSYDSWTTADIYERGKIEKVSATTAYASMFGATDVDTANELIKFKSRLLDRFDANAKWVMNSRMWANICTLRDANKQYLLNPQMLFSGVTPQLLGKPVVMFDDLPNAVTASSDVLYYGDFVAGYQIVDRIGVRILRDPYSSKLEGMIEFTAKKRTGGAIKNFQAIKKFIAKSS
jgi:HK97 family phage major capsid protein